MSDLREQIDSLNDQILALVQQRAEIVLEIARLKREQGLEGHDPQREEEMLQRLTEAATGPFGPAEVRAVFRAIFRASLAIQHRLAADLAVLNPQE
ncbi:MAG TPA: chorismate mutase [Thermoanaerobaculia bacterium]|nr:chorismate mutase [Thermoanaerobaculia bacterium]